MAKSPKNVTIYGRLSFPTFDYQQAVAKNAKSNFAKADPADVTPDFNLLVEKAQLDKLKKHVLDEFLPYEASVALGNLFVSVGDKVISGFVALALVAAIAVRVEREGSPAGDDG